MYSIFVHAVSGIPAIVACTVFPCGIVNENHDPARVAAATFAWAHNAESAQARTRRPGIAWFTVTSARARW